MAKKKSKSGAKKTNDETPVKKKAKSVSFVTKRRSRPRRNPDDSVALMITDLASQAVPVVVTFAGTHVLAHVVGDRLLGGRSWSKHLKVLTALAAVTGTYFAGRTRPLEKYSTGALVGSTLAAIQTIVQAYLPQIAWVLGGGSVQMVQPQLQAAQPQQARAQAGTGSVGDDDGDDDFSDLQGIFSGAGAGSGWNADLS